MSIQLINQYYNKRDRIDHKEGVIELLRKVTTVSMGTMEIISQMENEKE